MVDPIIRLHKASLTFTNNDLVSSTKGLVSRFFLFHIPEYFFILFKIGFIGAFTVPIMVTFIYTVVASNVIHISPVSLLLLFYVALAIPSFPVLRKHDLVADPTGLIVSIMIIIRLIV